jgi:hypothetical protein
MAEIIDVVTRLLDEMSLAAKGWVYVRPGRNAPGPVVLQNPIEYPYLEATFELHRRELDTGLSDDELKQRIRDAIANAKKVD